MNAVFPLKKNTVHLWRVAISNFESEAATLATLLSSDELERRDRFKFAIHQQRYAITRGIFRLVLSRYLQLPPAEIVFSYGAQGKPFIEGSLVNFNISHSHDLAVFAFSLQSALGVDVEKVELDYKEGVAKRFFSPQEVGELNRLPEQDRALAFYQIWSKKEAFIKALGEGLFAPLDSFSVTVDQDIDVIPYLFEAREQPFFVKNFFVHPDYQAAVATNQVIDQIEKFEWTAAGIIEGDFK